MTAPILCALDGVLADSRRPILDSVNGALVALGLGARPEAEVARMIGPPTNVGFEELLGLPPDSPVVTEAVIFYRALYGDALWDTPSYPGVPEMVRALGGRLGVATSKPRPYAGPVLEAIGLDDVFEVVVGPMPDESEDTKLAMVAEASDQLGGAVAMVGDRRFDIEAARALGLHAIGVTWGFGSREELIGAGAEVLVDTPEQLLEALFTVRRATAPPG